MPRRKTTTIEQVPTTEQAKTRKRTRRANGEGSVIERSDGRFEVQFSLPDGSRKSAYGKTRKEALAKAKKIQQQIEQNTYVPPSRETVAEYLERWLNLQRVQWEDGTYIYRRCHVETHLIPALGRIKLQQLSLENIQALYVKLQTEKQLKPRTIRLIHATLKQALDAAVRERKIALNPARDAILPKIPKTEMRYLSAEEFARLLEASQTHRHGNLFILAIATGMRRGELLALKWEDVDLENSVLHVRRSLSYHNPDKTGPQYKEVSPKTASGMRTILLPDFAVTALRQQHTRVLEKRLRAKRWTDLDLVFPNSKGEHLAPMNVVSSYKHFRRVYNQPAGEVYPLPVAIYG